MARTQQSRSATPQGLELANTALQKVSQGKKTLLADFAGVSRSTVSKFFNSQPIGLDNFQIICEKLELDWMVVAGLSEATEAKTNLTEVNQPDEINDLVQKTRQQIQPYIQECCGTMRVLDMTQPIELGKIYTNVNILEKITGKTWREIAQLQEKVSRENFERWCRGTVKEERIPGIEAAEKFSKLMILGKPGAGKTTFLKHLAIQCIGEGFQAERVPVFITLKDFADVQEHPNLLEYLQNLLKRYSDEMQDISTLSSLLKAGKFLILLDGLDEVREIDSSRILREIKQLSQQFPQNQFIITCRIAAKEYTFEKFTEVEVADFNEEQIADFSEKWFHSKNDPVKAERFLEKLKQDEPILELATNPLLLTLLCLVFEDAGSFPSNRADLYKNGLDVLLKKWDANRNIERDQVYKGLSLKRKEDLLSRIAYTTFQAGDYLFKKQEIERYISEYIQNLRNAKTDPKALELDSEAVLKSIEAQHGLLVERARNIYSFSHLTFHEYLTACEIVTSCNQCDINDPTLIELVSHITEKRWREVFLLTVNKLKDSSTLLKLMKYKIDNLITKDSNLGQFIVWLNKKSKQLESHPKKFLIRLFYFFTELESVIFSKRLNLLWLKYFDFFNDVGLNEKELLKSPSIACDLALARILSIISIFQAIQLEKEYTEQHINEVVAIFENNFRRSILLVFIPIRLLYFSLIFSLKQSSALGIKLQQEITKLKHKVPQLDLEKINTDDEEAVIDFWETEFSIFIDWIQSDGEKWKEQLRRVMIQYRNIGHNWKFNDEQKELLQQYYDANLLLVECLNSDCYVSREVRQEIEETLLLPIEEMEKWKSRRKDEH
ncbi:MAG: NACHT domain-containing NTPase [Limnoraphis sp. WC205]|nr:NACHT domain-containing NTPase [Limnoraphis sp. WC205]